MKNHQGSVSWIQGFFFKIGMILFEFENILSWKQNIQ